MINYSDGKIRLSVGKAEEYGMEPGEGKWICSCDTHGTYMVNATKQLAIDSLHVRDWCDGCSKLQEKGKIDWNRDILKKARKGIQVGNYIFPQEEYDSFMSEYEEIKDEIDNYLKSLDELYNNGGIIYRVLFIPKGKKIRTDRFLGNHWTVDEMSAVNYADVHFNETGIGIMDDQKDYDSYIIVGKVGPGVVDIRESLDSTIVERNYDESEAFIPNGSHIEIVEIKKV